jgi:organic hydroperoxide reductase OsmC/OhrA
MMGTFATVLAKSAIPTPGGRFRADVAGDIENVDGVLKITRIAVHYTLKLPKDKRPEAEACLERYLTLCPAAQSVVGCIRLEHRLELLDLDGEGPGAA